MEDARAWDVSFSTARDGGINYSLKPVAWTREGRRTLERHGKGDGKAQGKGVNVRGEGERGRRDRGSALR